jgi:hypothetical protein
LAIHTLPCGWDWAKGETVLHASFQLLVDFIECERPDEWINWDSDELHQHAWAEMTALYDWWTVERPGRETLSDRLEGIPSPDFGEECVLITKGKHKGLYEYVPQRDRYPDYYAVLHSWHDTENTYDAEDQLNLHRLIDVRQSMWT